MKQLTKIILLIASMVFFAPTVFAESKVEASDDGSAVVCKAVDDQGKIVSSGEGLPESFELDAKKKTKGAKKCCKLPSGAWCYAYKCSKCRKMCEAESGVKDGPATTETPSGR